MDNDTLSIAWKAIQHREQLKRCWELLQPAINEIKKAWPELSAIGKEIIPQILPQMRAEMSEPIASFDARWVQTALIKLGYYKGKADNVFGAQTEQAVKEFQVANKLKDQDGWPTMHTCVALWQAVEAKIAAEKVSTAKANTPKA